MAEAIDSGSEQKELIRLQRRQANKNRTIAVAVHIAALLIWEFGVRWFEVPKFILPSPSEVIQTITAAKYDWFNNSLVTASEILGGYLLAIILGIVTALLFSWSKMFSTLAFPLLITLNMIPKVALGPLVIVWFSYGISTNILITFSLCYFPILLTTIRGLREIEPDLLDLVNSLRGTKWQQFIYIQLPGAMPFIFSGMKVATILAVAGAVVGEFIASDRGLAYLMIQVQASLDTPAMFMAVTLITLIGMLLYLAVLFLEHMVVPQDARKS